MGVTLTSDDQSLSVYCPFGADGPKDQGGGPNLARVVRPRRKPITEWQGRNELQLAISVLFDNFDEGTGVEIERKIRVLEKMRGQDAGDPEPPQLIVQGDPKGAIPNDYHDAKHLRWWLEEIQPNDEMLERNHAGNRIRWGAVLLLTEVVEDDPIGNLKAANHKTNKGGGTVPKKYTVKRGDTLSKIAAKYKTKGGWKALAKLNKIRDPKRLKVGQVIRLK